MTMVLTLKQRWEVIFLCTYELGSKFFFFAATVKHVDCSRSAAHYWIEMLKKTDGVVDGQLTFLQDELILLPRGLPFSSPSQFIRRAVGLSERFDPVIRRRLEATNMSCNHNLKKREPGSRV